MGGNVDEFDEFIVIRCNSTIESFPPIAVFVCKADPIHQNFTRPSSSKFSNIKFSLRYMVCSYTQKLLLIISQRSLVDIYTYIHCYDYNLMQYSYVSIIAMDSYAYAEYKHSQEKLLHKNCLASYTLCQFAVKIAS